MDLTKFNCSHSSHFTNSDRKQFLILVLPVSTFSYFFISVFISSYSITAIELFYQFKIIQFKISLCGFQPPYKFLLINNFSFLLLQNTLAAFTKCNANGVACKSFTTSQLEPASDILTYKLEVTSYQNKIFFNL